MRNDYYDSLTTEQISRWMSLLLAVDQIDDYCEETNKPFSDEFLKPVAIKHFIQEKSKTVQTGLTKEEASPSRTNFGYVEQSNNVAIL